MPLKDMTFATPAPDVMTPRAAKMDAVARSKRTGRPKRGARHELSTIAWFNYVRIGLGQAAVSGVAKQVQQHVESRGLTSDHVGSKRWYRYRDGKDTPDATTLKLVDELVPGSCDFLNSGPLNLWQAVWDEPVPAWDEDLADGLLRIHIDDVDFSWFVKIVAMWSKRAALAKLGVAEKLTDGFYEAVHIGLNHANVKTLLIELGIWTKFLTLVRAYEAQSIRLDVKKTCEIRAVANDWQTGDAVTSYLDDPVGFAIRANKNAFAEDAPYVLESVDTGDAETDEDAGLATASSS